MSPIAIVVFSGHYADSVTLPVGSVRDTWRRFQESVSKREKDAIGIRKDEEKPEQAYDVVPESRAWVDWQGPW